MKILLYAMASGMFLAGCANSPIDRDFRAKVQDIIPISARVDTTGVHLDIAKIDFRDPGQKPLPVPAGLSK